MTMFKGLRNRIASHVWLRLIVLVGATLIVVSSILLVLVLAFYDQRLRAAQNRSADMM
ncbi:MAG: hypothetical protein ACK5LJ_18330 [Paracoccus sp. (in: a-proteobacteria)]